ncbi:hypothetical protein HID58_093381, partial [Brassica napus]
GQKIMQHVKGLTLKVREGFLRSYLENGFNQNTFITRSNHVNDELYLNLTDFQSVLSGTLDENFLIDVLGQVIDCDNITNHILTTIRSDSRLPCCIWGNLAEKLHSAINQEDGMVTMLLRINDDDKTLTSFQSNEDSQENNNKQVDQFWLHLMVNDDTGVSKIMILDKVANLLNGSWDEDSIYLSESQETADAVSTPSSKRKEDETIEQGDLSSTSKKPCTRSIKIEMVEEANKKR